jgi:hypothetical protein
VYAGAPLNGFCPPPASAVSGGGGCGHAVSQHSRQTSQVRVFRANKHIRSFAPCTTDDLFHPDFGIPAASPNQKVGGLIQRAVESPMCYTGSTVSVPGGDYDVMDGPGE